MNNDNGMSLETETYQRYKANQGVMWVVGDEPGRYVRSIESTAERLKMEGHKDLEVWSHDKIGGWYKGLPQLNAPKDGSDSTDTALMQAMTSRSQITAIDSEKQPPFDQSKDLILVMIDVHDAIEQSPTVVQQIRNIIQANLASEMYSKDEGDKDDRRGRRMLVFITPKAKLVDHGNRPILIPEIKPIIVPLPDEVMIGQLVREQFEDLAAANKKDSSRGCPMPTDKDIEFIIESLLGLTYYGAENALSRAIIANKKQDENKKAVIDLEGLYNDIEHEKALIINEIPGLTYVSRREMPSAAMPGYEMVQEFIAERMAIKPSVAKKHGNFQPLQGFMLAGPPGCGKTQFGMMVAKLTDRIMLILNLGEILGSYVGQSEANLRRALQVAQAMRGIALLDDVDKSGTASAAKGQSGDSGVMGRIVQMLLTEMSSPWNKVIWIFTANRVANIDTALKRAGRLDEQFYVELPDEQTRYFILNHHLKKFSLTADNDDVLHVLASDKYTDRWSGAELAHVLVKEAAIKALSKESDTVDTAWMLTRAKSLTPFAEQPGNKEDIDSMENDCKNFRRVGRINPSSTPSTSRIATSERRKRNVDV